MSTLGKHYNVCHKTQKMVKNSSLCTELVLLQNHNNHSERNNEKYLSFLTNVWLVKTAKIKALELSAILQ